MEKKSKKTQTRVSNIQEYEGRCCACGRNTFDADSRQFNCGHVFCMECIRRFFKDPIERQLTTFRCPLCSAILTEEDLKNYDPKFAAEKAAREKREAFGDIEITTCPQCKYQFIYEPGIEAGITKDEKGKEITGKALECLRLNRCTCSQCRTTFCVSCHAKPFHDGLTCELFRLKNEGICCRFCEEPFEGCDKILDPAKRVCNNPECQENLKMACMHVLECGHPCPGIKGEKEHLECGVCGFDVCCICAEPFSVMPSIKLGCGHVCHLKCAQEIIKTCSTKGLLTFPLCKYAGCGKVITHPMLKVDEFVDLHNRIEAMIPELIKKENVDKDPHVVNPEDEDYFNKPDKFIRDRFAFYRCQQCGTPFYGGMKACDEERPPDVVDSDCLCPKCSKIGVEICPKHGNEYMVFKCFFCCKPAAFHCWGTTHFCAECHKDPGRAQAGPYPPCDGHCGFAPHPPNGTRKYFGYCRLCQSESAK